MANDLYPSEITRLLSEAREGDERALDRLIPLVYDDLRGIAHRKMRTESGGHTLDTGAVVAEAYVRLSGQDIVWRDRVHFFAVASRVMRHVLIDYARKKSTDKRGGDAVMLPLSDATPADGPDALEMIELDQALTRLGEIDSGLEELVEYRFFGGLSMDEAAEAIGVSTRTATRNWQRARTYLFEMLRP
jgi:RNA polymerase sigma factor (TIGR02999 family)